MATLEYIYSLNTEINTRNRNGDSPLSVAVQRNVRHDVYGKTVKKTYKLKAHDEENACQIGDKVKVMETRPLSKDKRWRVVEILEKAVIK